MLFKLLKLEASQHVNTPDSGTTRYRQMFLTQSHVLAQRVQEYYAQLADTANLSTVHQKQHPGVDNQDLLDLDEEADTRRDLPLRFSQLRDEHFPLFVTYDQVSRNITLFEPPFGSFLVCRFRECWRTIFSLISPGKALL